MTYLLSSAGALITDRNTWHTRADQAWGDSQSWNTGTSYRTQRDTANASLAAMTTDRDTWQARANTAYDSGTWGSGTPWSTRYSTLHNALNNPDSSPNYVTAGASIGITDGTIVTLALPKAGHWIVSAVCSASGTWHEQSGTPSVTFTGSGSFSGSQSISGGLSSGNSGNFLGGAGFVAQGTYGSGTAFTVSSTSWRFDSGTRSVTIYAHYVASTAYDN